MRRRICIGSAGLCAASLAFGVVGASAAAPAVTKLVCKTSVGVAVAQGDTAVVPNVASGAEYGPARCGKPFGKGVQSVTFKVPDSGDRVGLFQTFFPAGSIKGKYTLVPQTGTFDENSFNTTQYLGVMKITGGTGAYQNVRGTAKMKCKSVDGVHTTCTNRLILTHL